MNNKPRPSSPRPPKPPRITGPSTFAALIHEVMQDMEVDDDEH